MEILRYTTDVYGRKLLVGVSWDLLWVPVALAGIAIIVHQVIRARRRLR